ncbi:ATP-dependent DNA helicase [Speluncibacter jeojiensis]|uniref:DNA 3'-5' helicase n=1 Tax=Speluncibacter jeojiensis TaxID=2710754 RepID=A0A9X4LXB9_9ACTN|nr:ATP-dependent helicase [Corynebacteriales bacterium D3-21]
MSEGGAGHGDDRRWARLVPQQQVDAADGREWTGAVADLLAEPDSPVGGAVQILGGPGTGKTSLLIDLARNRLARAGTDPESLLVLAQSRRAALRIREAVTAGLLVDGRLRATREPLVRTVHSYAFGVLRLHAARHDNPPPRLIPGAEQDAVIRELLRGDELDGTGKWPPHLRPALGLAGFAHEVRDVMLRATERGLGPEGLATLWQHSGYEKWREVWEAVADFAVRYEHVQQLRASVGMEAPEATAPAVNAAELVGAALDAFTADPELLAAERSRIRYLLVDDAQHLDPLAAELVRALVPGSALAAIAGDPAQSIFRFRGASPRFLEGLGAGRSVALTVNHRSDEAVVRAAAGIARKMPRHLPQSPAPERSGGVVRVEVHTTAAKEAAAVADTLRRAHLVDGVPWSSMAVIVRSVPLSMAPLRRALLAAGVPVITAAAELPPARQHGTAGLLLALRAVAAPSVIGGFGPDDALALLAGPLGGADPIALRRLRRGLRRLELGAGGERDSAELVRSALLSAPGDPDTDRLLRELSEVESAPLVRVRRIVAKARAAVARGRGVEEVLWALWQASGLQRRWVEAAARGGSVGAQADRDLDAVVALFDAAADHADRSPSANVSGFVDHIVAQEIPGGSRLRAEVVPEAVTVLSAHAAAGREWDVVVVVGVQEGIWPNLRTRGTLLGVGDLVDAVELGGGPGQETRQLSKMAPLLDEERQLFTLACSRARSRLLVTAVESAGDGDELVPSRFLDEIRSSGEGDDTVEPEDTGADGPEERRVLALPALVAELRSVVCTDPGDDGVRRARRDRAARELARLAAAGVPGAHPDQWYGLAPSSTDAPLWRPEDGPVRLSPSTVETLHRCPLRWLLERHGGTDGDSTTAVTGTLVHTLVQAVAGNVPDEQVRAALGRAWTEVDLGSPWFSRHELVRTEGMLESFRTWLRETRTELTEAGVEVTVEGVLPAPEPGGPDVKLTGRIDRLERDALDRPVIVDVKTAKTPVSKADAEAHAQLATYQVAAAKGLVEGVDAGEPGGAKLVFVAKRTKTQAATERTQAPLDGDRIDEWIGEIHRAAAATRGPTFEAMVNDGCRHCPVRTSCPVQDSGRQVCGA